MELSLVEAVVQYISADCFVVLETVRYWSVLHSLLEFIAVIILKMQG